MDSQFKQLLSTIKSLDRRLSALEGYNQVKTIKDSNGDTIIDSSGLNSLSNFSHGQVLNASSPTISSGSYTTISGSTMNTFTLSRTTNVLIYFLIDGYMHDFSDTTTYYLNVGYFDNDTDLLQDLFVTGNLFSIFPSSYNTASEFASQIQFVQLPAGTHQFSLKGKIDGFVDTQSGELLNWAIGYILFGN